MLLSDEEIRDILLSQQGTYYMLYRNIAKAQLQKVIEWGKTPCPHGAGLIKRQCPICWQELERSIGGE